MKFLILAAALLLTGCGATDFFVRKEVVIQHEYVVRKATDQQKVLPAYPANIDVQTADQIQLSQWIADNEKRQLDLESIIKRLIEFYEAAPTAEEKEKATPKVEK